MLAQDSSDRVGVGRALAAPDDGAGIVDDADGGRLERDVEADIMTLLIHAFLRVALTLQSLPACLASGRRPAITPCPVACNQVRGARGRGQGTEMLAELGGLPPPAFAGAGFSEACVSQRPRPSPGQALTPEHAEGR